MLTLKIFKELQILRIFIGKNFDNVRTKEKPIDVNVNQRLLITMDIFFKLPCNKNDVNLIN